MIRADRFRHIPCHYLVEMSFTDLLILYLSLGAPVLVAYIVTKRCAGSFAAITYAAVILFFWPLFAAVLLYQKYGRRLSSLGIPSGASNIYTRENDRIDIIRKRIEKIIRGGHRPSEIYRWRSDFDRYVSVGLELSVPAEDTADYELTKVVQHPDPDIANACHQRRINGRLVSQQASSRAELIRTTQMLCADSSSRTDVEQLLLSLVLLLDDRLGEDDVRDAFGQIPGEYDVSNIGKEVWQPQI